MKIFKESDGERVRERKTCVSVYIEKHILCTMLNTLYIVWYLF
jgi:hypothetical protein